MADISPSTQDIFSQLYSSTMKGNAALDKVGSVSDKGVKEQLATDKKLLAEAGNESVPKSPKMDKDLPKEPDPKDSVDPNPFNVFRQFAPAMLVLGSAFARHNNTAAITAAATMMNSYQQGNKEQYEQAREKWKDSFDKMIEEHKIDLDQYEADIKESKGKMDVLQAKLQASAAIRGDTAMLNAIQTGNMGTAIDKIEKQRAGLDKLVDAKIKIDKAQQQGQSNIDDSTLNQMADQFLAGDHGVMTGLGRGTQGAANIVALREKIASRAAEQNMSGTDIARKLAEFKGLQAEETTIGRQEGNVQMAATEAKKMSGILRQVSAKVPRSDIAPVADGEVKIEKAAGDISAAQLTAAVNTYINVYARAINPKGVGTVSDKEHAREIITAGIGDGQLNGVLDILDKEVDAALSSPGAVKESLGGKGGDAKGKVVHWDDLKE